MFGTKKRTIHNIPDYNIDRILKAIPNKLKYYIKIKDMFVVLKVMLLKVKCFKLKKGTLGCLFFMKKSPHKVQGFLCYEYL
ncbi:hypothetical protein RBTH_04759 [Bacillus thuringiensis serovar israelensis ATCC 35646]|nr:hypothetical protein RBTH_04759 [Bacillus thuringiensis serovar israelensis ATCC 35646]KQB19595.1 hypothetical protein AL712_27470 [Bacillus thuringiensis]